MKFVLLVEGETEKSLRDFLGGWLNERLNTPVGIQVIPLHGWTKVVDESPRRARLYLNSPKGDVIAVVALLDLYGLELRFPANTTSAQQRCDWAKEHLEKKVGHPKFRQFFAVHETEAWLLSDPTIFPTEMQAELRNVALNPEAVNDTKPPAKRLDDLYLSKMGRGYEKTAKGMELFGKLKVNTAYDRCPNLKTLLDEMLALAKAAGH